jgi:hypothetical protein
LSLRMSRMVAMDYSFPRKPQLIASCLRSEFK